MPGQRVRGLLYRLYQRRLRRNLERGPLPKHVAMILDGNRRWARQRRPRDRRARAPGRRREDRRVRSSGCDELGIPVVTLYLLSTDNLTGRHERGARRAVRDHRATSPTALSPTRLAGAARRYRRRACRRTLVDGARGGGGAQRRPHRPAHQPRGRLRRPHARSRTPCAASSPQHQAEGGSLDDLAELLTPELIGEHLYTGGQPDPDLVIRTSGEQRLSDFMLWQSAHSEFYFVEALGPDLREVDFLRALR